MHSLVEDVGVLVEAVGVLVEAVGVQPRRMSVGLAVVGLAVALEVVVVVHVAHVEDEATVKGVEMQEVVVR